MQVIENSKVKEKLYIEKLENGLTIMVIPKNNTRKKYVIWGINYGSIDNKFIVPGKQEITEVPNGVAHFLEHKMFEQQDGTNSLDTLTALGVSANAYTTNDHTAYLFECTDNFYEALDELMDYVQNPHFTKENVEKEKGIIGQEIAMYDDYPDWKVYLNTVKCLYKNNPVNIDITGTKETISHITKDILYDCYNTFYHPSNTVMCICGDFVPEKIVEEIKNRIVKKENHGEIKRIYEEEPNEINQKEITEKMEVSKPIFIIGYKDTLPQEDMVKRHIALEIILNIVIGNSSELYQELYNEEYLNNPLDLSYEFARTFSFIMLTGQSKDPEHIKQKINEKIENIKQTGLNEQDFERTKKQIYGNYIKEYNDVSEIARMFLADHFKGINSFDYLEEYTTITKEYTEQILNQILKQETQVISIIEPKWCRDGACSILYHERIHQYFTIHTICRGVARKILEENFWLRPLHVRVPKCWQKNTPIFVKKSNNKKKTFKKCRKTNKNSMRKC